MCVREFSKSQDGAARLQRLDDGGRRIAGQGETRRVAVQLHYASKGLRCTYTPK